MSEETQTTQATEPTATETPAVTGLSIQDLTLTLQIIQAVTARGAIKAEEMAVVGGLYERIFKFLDSIGALSRAPETTPAEAPAEGTSAETEGE